MVKWRGVGLWTGVKSNMAKQLPLQAQRSVSVKDTKGRPLSQTDTPARPSAEHSADAVGPTLGVTHGLSRFTRLELNAALRKATRNKAGVDDLPQRFGNGAQRYLTLASSRPSQLARFLSNGRRHWGSRFTSVKVPFGSQQLQPDQPVEHAYQLILACDYNFRGWLSVVNFGAG